jgi:hypothetical protein
MESGVMKTSAVMVASGGSRFVYGSIREVPEPLRTQVIRSTSGRNSGTILIADRRGKEEIERAARAQRGRPIPAVIEGRLEWRRVWPIAVALLIVLCGAAAVFFARA